MKHTQICNSSYTMIATMSEQGYITKMEINKYLLTEDQQHQTSISHPYRFYKTLEKIHVICSPL